MAEKSRRNSGRDFISNLPDVIITYILSLVPTKSAVATSLLSKKWNHNHLWTSVPHLDFGKHTIHHPGKYPVYEKFVDRVFALNNVPSLRIIRLHHNGSPGLSRVNAWISSITKRDTEELDLKLCTSPNFVLPGDFFDKKILVKLKLDTDLCKIPRFVSFPNLVTIKLRCSRWDDEDAMKNLLVGCPLLKNFYIRILECGDAHTFHISSPTLEILHLEIYYVTYSDENITIDAPNLRDFVLENHSSASYYITNASAMTNLNLDVEGGDDDDDAIFQILRNMDIFRNLIHLTVAINQWVQWENFPRMLQRAPNLTTVALRCDNIPVRWKNPDVVPRCLMSCLESVSICTGFEESGNEEKMISYFLEKASSLKKLYIKSSVPTFLLPGENDFIRTLSSLARSSTHCQVYFRGDAIST